MVIIGQLFLFGALRRQDDYFVGPCVLRHPNRCVSFDTCLPPVRHRGILRFDATLLHRLRYNAACTCTKLPQISVSDNSNFPSCGAHEDLGDVLLAKTTLQTAILFMRHSTKLDVLTSHSPKLLSLGDAQEPVGHHLKAFFPIRMLLVCMIVYDSVFNLRMCAYGCVYLFTCVSVFVISPEYFVFTLHSNTSWTCNS